MRPAFLTSQQLCDELQMSATTLRRLRAEGVIPTYRIRTMIRYDLEEVKAALRRSGNEAGMRRIQGKFIKSGGPRAGRGKTERLGHRVKESARQMAADSVEEALGLPAKQDET